MKLSFTTLGCPDWSFDKILFEAQQMGYHAIEIRGIEGQMRADKMAPFLPGQQQDTIRKVRAHNLEFCGFGSSTRFDDANKLDEMMEEARIAIDVCARMGIPYVRVFGDKVEEEASEQRAIDAVAEGISALCDYAKGTDVGILLEVHGNYNLAHRVVGVANQVASPKFGVLWDIEHSDKTYEDNFEAFYRPIQGLVRHIHVKDHIRGNGEFKLCHVGRGDIPIPAIISMLEKDNYKGYYSLEWEKKWHPELPDAEIEFPAYINYMKNILG